jgi:hypothetical protein
MREDLRGVATWIAFTVDGERSATARKTSKPTVIQS